MLNGRAQGVVESRVDDIVVFRRGFPHASSREPRQEIPRQESRDKSAEPIAPTNTHPKDKGPHASHGRTSSRSSTPAGGHLQRDPGGLVSELVATAFEDGGLPATLSRLQNRNTLINALIAAIVTTLCDWSER